MPKELVKRLKKLEKKRGNNEVFFIEGIPVTEELVRRVLTEIAGRSPSLIWEHPAINDTVINAGKKIQYT